MKRIHKFLIVALCFGLQSYGINKNNEINTPQQQAAKELTRALTMDNDYAKAESILKQYPELAKGIEYNVSAGAIKLDPLDIMVDLTIVPNEQLDQALGIVGLLLKLGADVNKFNKRPYDSDKSILQEFAAQNVLKNEKRKDAVGRLLDMLLAAGANINAQDSKGRTPLMEALGEMYGNIDMVKLLIENGKADINLRDKKGKTATQLLNDAYNKALQQLKKDETSTLPFPFTPEDQELMVKDDQKRVDTFKAVIEYLESRMKPANKKE